MTMKIEQALELVISCAEGWAIDNDDPELARAADILREGEQPVEVVKKVTRRKCRACGHVDTFNFTTFCPGCKKYLGVRPPRINVSKTYTTHRRLTFETVENVPVFEEIEDNG